MQVFALFALIGLATAGYAPANVANTGNSVQTRTQDSVGNYAFSYQENHATGGTTRKESGNAYGQVVGSYSLGIIDGRQRIVNYVADPVHGFRAQVLTNEPGTAPTSEQVVAQQQLAAAAHVAAPVVAKVAAPVAAPIISSYSAPIVAKVAPAYGYSAPIAAPVHGYSTPIVAKVASPYVQPALSYAAPAPIVAKVAAPAYGYSAPLPSFSYSTYASHAAPVVAKIAAPAISYAAPAPIVTKVAAPAYGYSAPIVQQHAW